MSANKITAHFGADTSEIEAKMIQATRATKAYERAVKAIDGAKVGPESVTRSLSRTNEELNKGLTLLKGGAITAGVGMVIGWMRSWSDHAKQMGSSATEAQKSAAKWGEELESFTGTIKGWGASVLGTLASWGRNIGDVFRDPSDKAYDAVAESSEESARRQEKALADLKAAHEKAAAEIPKLQKQLEGEQRETRLSQLSEQGRAMTELFETQKALAELEKQPSNNITKARRLELLAELEKRDRKLAEINKKIREEEEREAVQLAEKKSAAEQKLGEDVADVIEMISDASKKADEAAIARARELAEEREKAAKAASEENRKKFGEQLGAAGLSVGDDGRLRRGRVVVSNEDAARTLDSRRRNEEFTAVSKRGEIRGSSGPELGPVNFDEKQTQLLAKIVEYLRPRNI